MVNSFQLIVIVAIILVIFLFVKLRYVKHKTSWVILLVLALLLYIGYVASTAGYDVNLKSYEGSKTAMKLYLVWIGNTFSNLKSLTGQVTKLDWKTNTSEIKEKVIPG